MEFLNDIRHFTRTASIFSAFQRKTSNDNNHIISSDDAEQELVPLAEDTDHRDDDISNRGSSSAEGSGGSRGHSEIVLSKILVTSSDNFIDEEV